eukprot:scaffold27461_cov37-Prasinocladus_malaysianus.AAC.1
MGLRMPAAQRSLRCKQTPQDCQRQASWCSPFSPSYIKRRDLSPSQVSAPGALDVCVVVLPVASHSRPQPKVVQALLEGNPGGPDGLKVPTLGAVELDDEGLGVQILDEERVRGEHVLQAKARDRHAIDSATRCCIIKSPPMI